jgi:hypothetical protein
MATSEAFQKAVKESKQLTEKPESFDLLELYGMFLSRLSPAHPSVEKRKRARRRRREEVEEEERKRE